MTLSRRLALAVGVIAAVAAPYVWFVRRPANDLAELAAAVGEARPVEPRLTGGFRYAPPVRTRASDSASVQPAADVRIAVGRLEKRAAAQPSPGTSAALGVAYLVSGDAARAVPALEEAVDRAEPPGGSLSDLAAAYLIRASAPQHAQDLARALTFAERAVNAEPKRAEAWFNRALALEALSLRAAARDAWGAYLRVDAASGWASEARERLRALTDTGESAAAAARREADAAIARLDRSAIDRLIGSSPQAVRDAMDDRLLGEWPRLVLDGRRDEAGALIDHLAAPASALAKQRNDAFYVDCVNAMKLASRDVTKVTALARAHQSYRRAVEAYNDDRIADAARQFSELVRPIDAAGSPLVWPVKRYIAIGIYYANDFAAALSAIRAVRDDPSTAQYPRIRALALRLSGLIHVVRGEFTLGLTDYQLALVLFASAGDIDSEAQMYTSLAEDYHYLGNTNEAWTAWLAALRRIDRVQERRTRHLILQGAATAALREDLAQAALHLQQAALENAQAWRRPPAVVTGYLNRAEIHNRLHLPDRAMADLTDADRYLASVHDPLLTSRNEARIYLARGETINGERPAEAVEALTKALSYFERTGTSARLAAAYLARGRAQLAMHRSDLAEMDFLAGIGVFERMRASIASDALRSSYFEQPWDLFTEMIRLQIGRRDSSRALRYAEHARARTLLDALAPGHAAAPELPEDVRSLLPPGVTVVYFSALEDRLLIWTLSRGRQAFAEQPVRQAELARLLARYTDRTASRDSSVLATLYDHLIRPVAGNLPDGEPIVIVPDGVLHGVPFAGLVRSETGRFLVQDHAIRTAPSLTIFLRAADTPARTLAAGRALIIGNPRLETANAVTLPDAEREARDIAALYREPTLLVNETATKAQFIASAGSYDVVHFAGHALSNDDYPALSHLMFAAPNRGADGTLFAHEITRIPFERTRLVVLAACRTSAGRVRRGEGVFSLARPFLAAGVPTVVASLWDVDDRATRALFVAFHQALSRGAAPADALRAAQLAAIAAGDAARRDPANWASFAVIGSH